MCRHEVEWEVRDLSGTEKALFHIHVGKWVEDLAQSGFPLQVLDEPTSLGVEGCNRLYEELEYVRNQGAHELEIAKRHLRSAGADPRAFEKSLGVRHMRRSLELLMVTVGVGVLSDTAPAVAAIWHSLGDASDADLNEAVSCIAKERDFLSPFEAGASHWAIGLSEDQIRSMATIMPSFVARFPRQ